MRTVGRAYSRLQSLGTLGCATTSSRLKDWTDFGHNPGALEARIFVPVEIPPGAALVVALHGCTQTADGYDRGTGWSTLADRDEFALLFPQQNRANNANLCFNWFEAADIGRTGGEAESIAEMVRSLVATNELDPARVFVTGLSAGGAMAAVMLATYPELFAGGAIIGGLPYAAAAGVPQALERMGGRGHVSDAQAVAALKRAAPGADAWPAVSLWHGTADSTVAHFNMEALGRQWRGLHDLPAQPSRIEKGSNWEHRTWCGPDGRPLVEEWSVAEMGHGVPIDAATLGTAGPHMLNVGLSSTRAIASGWGLTTAEKPDGKVAGARRVEPTVPVPASFAGTSSGVQKVIEDALRSARLLP